MSWISSLDHFQLTVPREVLAAAVEFYGGVFGLPEIEKPEALKKNGGAWFQLGQVQLHISAEPVAAGENEKSKRHVCFMTLDLAAMRQRLQQHRIEVIPDQQPVPEFERFYVRDPGGNRIEISERVR